MGHQEAPAGLAARRGGRDKGEQNRSAPCASVEHRGGDALQNSGLFDSTALECLNAEASAETLPLAERAFCKICHGEDNGPEDPLLHPCRCDGSVRFIHLRCFEECMRVRTAAQCDICHFPFIFKKVYAEGAPKQLTAGCLARYALLRLPLYARWTLRLLSRLAIFAGACVVNAHICAWCLPWPSAVLQWAAAQVGARLSSAAWLLCGAWLSLSNAMHGQLMRIVHVLLREERRVHIDPYQSMDTLSAEVRSRSTGRSARVAPLLTREDDLAGGGERYGPARRHDEHVRHIVDSFSEMELGRSSDDESTHSESAEDGQDCFTVPFIFERPGWLAVTLLAPSVCVVARKALIVFLYRLVLQRLRLAGGLAAVLWTGILYAGAACATVLGAQTVLGARENSMRVRTLAGFVKIHLLLLDMHALVACGTAVALHWAAVHWANGGQPVLPARVYSFDNAFFLGVLCFIVGSVVMRVMSRVYILIAAQMRSGLPLCKAAAEKRVPRLCRAVHCAATSQCVTNVLYAGITVGLSGGTVALQARLLRALGCPVAFTATTPYQALVIAKLLIFILVEADFLARCATAVLVAGLRGSARLFNLSNYLFNTPMSTFAPERLVWGTNRSAPSDRECQRVAELNKLARARPIADSHYSITAKRIQKYFGREHDRWISLFYVPRCFYLALVATGCVAVAVLQGAIALVIIPCAALAHYLCPSSVSVAFVAFVIVLARVMYHAHLWLHSPEIPGVWLNSHALSNATAEEGAAEDQSPAEPRGWVRVCRQLALLTAFCCKYAVLHAYSDVVWPAIGAAAGVWFIQQYMPFVRFSLIFVFLNALAAVTRYVFILGMAGHLPHWYSLARLSRLLGVFLLWKLCILAVVAPRWTMPDIRSFGWMGAFVAIGCVMAHAISHLYSKAWREHVLDACYLIKRVPMNYEERPSLRFSE